MRVTKKLKLLVLFSAFTNGTVFGSKLMTGDTAAAAGESLSFNLLTTSVFDTTNEFFYVASAADLTGGGVAADTKQYALAGTSSSASIMVPAAPATVTLNGTAGQTNPLYGAQISKLGLAAGTPVVVKAAETDAVYWVTSKLGAATQTMISATAINDAAAPGAARTITSVTGSSGFVFAIIQEALAANRGVALLKKTDAGLLVQQKAIPANETNAYAVPILLTAGGVVSMGQDATTPDATFSTMHWDSTLQRLYIGLDITSGGAAGARSVIVANMSQTGTNDTKLNLVAIAPTAAFATANNIVGGTGNGTHVKAYRIKTMHTSAKTSYLIVQRDDGRIDAVPLVNEQVDPTKAATWQTSATHGTVAKKNSLPTTYYRTVSADLQVFAGRGFQTPATAAGDLLNSVDDDLRAHVGRGTIAGATMTDMQVYRDTVFVTTTGATADVDGVFYSQALFDENGVIQNWTVWTQASYSLEGDACGVGYAPTLGKLITLEATPAAAPKKVRVSQWSDGALDGLLGGTTTNSSLGFIERVSAQFSSSQGGVLGLFNFHKSNPSFAGIGNANTLSLMVATGYNKVVIVKTGTAIAPHVATLGDFSTDQRTFTSGAISNISTEGAGVTANTAIISVSGGDLATLGAINSAAIIRDIGVSCYLIVGGTGGIAVLRTADRLGWADAPGLVKNLSDAGALSTDKTFQKIGTYTDVRKLWMAIGTANVQFLYILTSTALYRIPAAELANANPTATTLATPASLGLSAFDSFTDFIASDKLGLLATSAGLYRTGNGQNVSTGNSTTINWTSVTLPESNTSITKLVPVCTTVLPPEFATQGQGAVYVLSGSVSKQLSTLYQLTIKTVSGTAVTDTTVQLVPNAVLQGTASPLSSLGIYRNAFATNGATLLATSSQTLAAATELNRLGLATEVGTFSGYAATQKVDFGGTGSTLYGLERNSATGSWIVYGSFGLRVLE